MPMTEACYCHVLIVLRDRFIAVEHPLSCADYTSQHCPLVMLLICCIASVTFPVDFCKHFMRFAMIVLTNNHATKG